MKDEIKQFGKFRVRVTQFGTRKGLEVFTKITNTLGPALGTVINVAQNRKTGVGEEIGEALAALATAADPETMDYFLSVCSEYSELVVQDSLKPMDDAALTLCFAGYYIKLFKWLGFCLELNYGSFLEDPAILRLLAGGKEKSQSESPSTSIGESGK